MIGVVQSVFGRMLRTPLKAAALIVTFAINAALLSAVFTLHLSFNQYTEVEILGQGTRAWVAIQAMKGGGQEVKSLGFYTGLLPDLKKAAGLRYASPLAIYQWRFIEAEGVAHTVPGGVLGVYPDYAAMCDLEMAAGTFFSDQEAMDRKYVAVISENVAKALWSNAQGAIGKKFTTVVDKNDFSPSGTYTVVGVFREPSEMQRRFFQVPSIFMPFTYPGSIVPWIRVQSDDRNFQRVKNRIHAAFKGFYQQANMKFPREYDLPIWQGSLYDQFTTANTGLLQRIRMVSLFFTVMWVFCLLLMAFGVLALLSSDVSGRLRETGLRRALGSTQARAIAQIAGESAVVLAAANVLGELLMLAFLKPLLEAVKPLLAAGGNTAGVIFGAGPVWKAMLLSLGASIAAGALASLYPAYSATRIAPSDALREG